MSYNLSGCVFIRNCFRGAFCLFESMYQLLPLCDEFIVMDLGSDDGTLDALREIEAANDKVRIVQSTFYKQDAAIFADLANDLVAMCNYPKVLYYQADEIWHEDLIGLTKKYLDTGKNDLLSFWRVQLKYNFQTIKWFPHPVHRIAPKEQFHFTGDGMNTDKTYDAELVSSYDMGYFQRWGTDYKDNPAALPTNEMILDVSLTGAFLENIPDRRRMHVPFWGENINDIHMPADEDSMRLDNWMALQRQSDLWHLTQTPFNIPQIMRYHVGRQTYKLRPDLLEALKGDKTGWR